MPSRRLLPALPLLALACAAPAAMSAEADVPPDAAAPVAPDWSFPASVTLASDYLFRGLTQTNKKAALQAGVEADHASGLYAGAWGSNISWLSDLAAPGAGFSSSLELDAYAGYRFKFADAWGLDAGIYTYYYPGDYPPGFVSPDTTELYVALSWGVASLKYSHALTNLFGIADSKNSSYLDFSANWEFAPTWVLNAHAGRQRVDGLDAASYRDWKLGVTKNLAAGWSIALAWLDTDAERAIYTNPHGTYQGRATGLLTITKTF